MATACPWTIDGRSARLQTGLLQGVVNVDQPQAGMTDLVACGEKLVGNLWGWGVTDLAQPSASEAPALECCDVYARSDDLVVTYAPSKARPFETQFYWSAPTSREPQDRQTLSLMVSIRTQLLDTQPLVTVRSQRSAKSILLDSTKVLAASQVLGDDGPFLLEACHPGDESRFALGLEDDLEKGVVRWELFSHFLEKGVIRRARMLFSVTKTSHDTDQAYEEFLTEPLPLTT